MRKLKKQNKKKNTKRLEGVNYVCSNCNEEEIIPYEVLEEFDKMHPEQLMYGYHQLSCEKCKVGIMKPKEEPGVSVKGYGLFEGIEKGY